MFGVKTHRVLAAACAGLVALAVACGSDEEPKPAANATAAATTAGSAAAGSSTAEAGTPAATFVPETPPPAAAAPAGATELTPGDYTNLTALSLSCDGNNMLVLRTKEETYYLQTIVRQNFGCENVRTNIVTAAGLKGEQANVVEGKVLDLKYAKLDQATAAGNYQANLNWKGSGSMLVIVVTGWKKKP